ncbi:MAG: hypothetical protein K9K32_03020 [Halanaerobiales bacterium]|nr:hypothetical protein [Halanaerobiales bacterium]
MKKIIFFMIISLIIVLFSSTVIFAQNEEPIDWLETLFYTANYNSFVLDNYILRLPEINNNGEIRNFSPENQKQLENLAQLYKSNDIEQYNWVLDQEFNNQNGEKNSSMLINPFPNVNLKIDYKDNQDDQEVESKTNFGISYQTSDKVTIFADYIYDNLLFEQSGVSTVFGLEYNNSDSKILAQYRIDDVQDSQGSSTGVTYQYSDTASFSASYATNYKLLDLQSVENTLKKENTWDFGLDFNLNEISSVSVGFQLTDYNNSDTDQEEEKKESNIEASFQIKF